MRARFLHDKFPRSAYIKSAAFSTWRTVKAEKAIIDIQFENYTLHTKFPTSIMMFNNIIFLSHKLNADKRVINCDE